MFTLKEIRIIKSLVQGEKAETFSIDPGDFAELLDKYIFTLSNIERELSSMEEKMIADSKKEKIVFSSMTTV